MIDGFRVPFWTQVNVCCRLVAPGEVSCIKDDFALLALKDLRLSCAFFDIVRQGNSDPSKLFEIPRKIAKMGNSVRGPKFPKESWLFQ
jgi:hypothetical protein